jgi:hypothetical protein
MIYCFTVIINFIIIIIISSSSSVNAYLFLWFKRVCKYNYIRSGWNLACILGSSVSICLELMFVWMTFKVLQCYSLMSNPRDAHKCVCVCVHLWVFWAYSTYTQIHTRGLTTVFGVLKLWLRVASSAGGSKVFRYDFSGDDGTGHQSALTCLVSSSFGLCSHIILPVPKTFRPTLQISAWKIG